MNLDDCSGNVRIDDPREGPDALPQVDIDLTDNGLRALIFSCLERGNAHPTLTGPQGISPEMVTGVRTRVQTRIRNPINRSVTATDLVDDAIRQYQAARPENDGNFVD
ncbi:hypothetical protein A2881_02835 [Candidatus Peribacteria bacterium RIFCSPHIGHO2_01_FULL_55_13]|nr:MAG: hypothetical protein A2881_02835 [Candidatus Peribacteria bacterium RIFCSPHIGHO2_01_FULL_55_13]OGJ65968.1 MAG: hypothetical protein A3F36_03090 [Candidatus Peribacteria bacterium RIFCSPHIGHO2_12_FULL_55_11]